MGASLCELPNLGHVLRVEREKRGLSLREVAARIYELEKRLLFMENGVLPLTVGVAYRVAVVLGMGLPELILAWGALGAPFPRDLQESSLDPSTILRRWRVQNKKRVRDMATLARTDLQTYWAIEINRQPTIRLPLRPVLNLAAVATPELLPALWERAAREFAEERKHRAIQHMASEAQAQGRASPFTFVIPFWHGERFTSFIL